MPLSLVLLTMQPKIANLSYSHLADNTGYIMLLDVECYLSTNNDILLCGYINDSIYPIYIEDP